MNTRGICVCTIAEYRIEGALMKENPHLRGAEMKHISTPQAGSDYFYRVIAVGK